ncbi:MAG: HipA domain-containing protein [Pseudomonadota bacterium]|nr:HipA domain-containing protein [Pseudomonadota bacterium]
MIISKPLYVYLQRPNTGDWITVGRYAMATSGHGTFMYAPSYIDAGCTWAIDPVNLPFLPGHAFHAPRYGGLHDVLRDASPDAWGQALLRREHNLPDATPLVRYLILSNNAHRWGALAVGASKHPSVANIATPKLPQLANLVGELQAISAHRPAIDTALRAQLMQTASVGGARPKATVQDGNGQFWLVKPRIATDVADIPGLEHMARQWGAASGLNCATTMLHAIDAGFSAVRVQRFDRDGSRRFMCVSAASLLQTEYPATAQEIDRWSYPRLAEQLKLIGAPDEDRHELFGRMVFNAVCGNDDDHVRNHAVYFRPDMGGWRLAPAFDVVPNAVETPRHLAMQLATGRFDIARDAILASALRFGFASRAEAEYHLDGLLERMASTFDAAAMVLDKEWAQFMRERLAGNLALLRRP